MKLTKRQLEMLKVYAGLIKESANAQAWYYGKPAVIDRHLKEKGLIQFVPARDGKAPCYEPTETGWAELQKRFRNFPADQAWKLASSRLRAQLA